MRWPEAWGVVRDQAGCSVSVSAYKVRGAIGRHQRERL